MSRWMEIFLAIVLAALLVVGIRITVELSGLPEKVSDNTKALSDMKVVLAEIATHTALLPDMSLKLERVLTLMEMAVTVSVAPGEKVELAVVAPRKGVIIIQEGTVTAPGTVSYMPGVVGVAATGGLPEGYESLLFGFSVAYGGLGGEVSRFEEPALGCFALMADDVYRASSLGATFELVRWDPVGGNWTRGDYSAPSVCMIGRECAEGEECFGFELSAPGLYGVATSVH